MVCDGYLTITFLRLILAKKIELYHSVMVVMVIFTKKLALLYFTPYLPGSCALLHTGEKS